MQLSIELRLLVQMVKQELLQIDSTFETEGIQWDKFRKACAYHGMRHMAYSANLKQVVLPAPLALKYKKFTQQRAKNNLGNIHEINHLYELFIQEGIYPVLLKGLLFTELLYDNKVLRESTDIDFLFKSKFNQFLLFK